VEPGREVLAVEETIDQARITRDRMRAELIRQRKTSQFGLRVVQKGRNVWWVVLADYTAQAEKAATLRHACGARHRGRARPAGEEP
jgi:uncharacterized protein (DUF2249 family)